MSILTDKLVEIGGVKYIYTERMHKKINKLADKFYTMQGYKSQGCFDYSESSHPSERLMYSMSLQAHITNGKVKPIKQQ